MEKDITYDNKPWLKYYEPEIKSELEYEDLYLPQFLDKKVKQFTDKLTKYKWPIKIEFTTELPKSVVGIILRKDLRAMQMEKRGK